jgi:hypothetical protein
LLSVSTDSTVFVSSAIGLPGFSLFIISIHKNIDSFHYFEFNKLMVKSQYCALPQ